MNRMIGVFLCYYIAFILVRDSIIILNNLNVAKHIILSYC